MLHLSAEEVHTQMRNSVIPHPNSVIPEKLARFVLNRFLGPKKWSSGYGKKNCIKQLCYATGSFHFLSMTGQTTISDTLDLRGGCPSQKCAIWSTNVTDCTIMKCAIWQKIVQASWNLSYANWCTTVQNVIKSGRGLFDSLIACFAIFLTTVC